MHKRPLRLLAAIVAVVALQAGCARPWVTANTAGIAAHAVVNASYKAVDFIRPRAVEESREDVVNAYSGAMEAYSDCLDTAENPDTCHDPGTPADWIVRWEQRVDGIYAAEDAVYTADDAVIAYSRAVAAWSAARDRDPPAVFLAACVTLGEALSAVALSLSRYEVRYPPELSQVLAILPPLCGWGEALVDAWSDQDAEELRGDDAT